MLLIVVALALAGTPGMASAQDDSNSAPNPVESLIVGGQPVSVTTTPWQTALLFSNGTNDGFLDQFCGGSLISAQWIVTAAHCVVDSGTQMAPNEIEIAVGVSVLSEIRSSDRLSVDQLFVHPSYTGDFSNDIALIRLVDPVLFSVSVAPIAIPNPSWQGALPAAGTEYIVSGWGCRSATSPDDDSCPDPNAEDYFADQLEAVVVADVSGPVAVSCGANADYEVEVMICAGDLAGGIDSCAGDSGGPLAVVPTRWSATLAGVVSFGSGCAEPSYPGLYTRVSAFSEWVTSTTGVEPGDSGWNPSFVPVEPGRVVDSRVSGLKVVDVSRFRVAGATVIGGPRAGELVGVPVDASAVALNVTVTGTEAPGFVSVYPCGSTSDVAPNVSNVNYVAGATVANSAVVPLEDGFVCVKAVGATDVLIDVAGYLSS